MRRRNRPPTVFDCLLLVGGVLLIVGHNSLIGLCLILISMQGFFEGI